MSLNLSDCRLSQPSVVPLVSVVIATFGRPAIVRRAINSVLNQTMSDLEVVVVVERNDEATVAALDAISDPHVRYVVNPEKKGPAAARDFGIRACLGTWIAFLDDDDEWLPTKLERQLAAVSGAANIISMTLSSVVTPVGPVVRPTTPFDGREPIDEWLFGRRSWFKTSESFLQTSSLMVPRSMFDNLQFGQVRHEEWELAIRAVKQFGFRLVTVPEPLVIYYTGNTSYPLAPSLAWIDHMRDVVTPRAYSGFCLTVAPQGLVAPSRKSALWTMLRMALSNGRPTLRQLFAFALIALIPHRLRQRVRVAFEKKCDSRVRTAQAAENAL